MEGGAGLAQPHNRGLLSITYWTIMRCARCPNINLSAVLRHAVPCHAVLCCAVQALCNSGVVYRELDRLEEAVAAYEDALAVSRAGQCVESR